MKVLILSILILTSFASAVDGGVWDQLVTDENDFFGIFTFSKGYSLADDCVRKYQYEYDGFAIHFIFVYEKIKSDALIEIYKGTLDSHPEYVFDFPAGTWDQRETGMSTWHCTIRDVYLGVFDFPESVILDFETAKDHKYWTAISVDYPEKHNFAAPAKYTEKDWDAAYQREPGSNIWLLRTRDTSMRMDGAPLPPNGGKGGTGIESASLGSIKATFK